MEDGELPVFRQRKKPRAILDADDVVDDSTPLEVLIHLLQYITSLKETEIKHPPSTVQPRIQPKAEVQIDNFKIPKFELIRELKQQRPQTRGYFQEFTSGFQSLFCISSSRLRAFNLFVSLHGL
jgi:hypothetical protein